MGPLLHPQTAPARTQVTSQRQRPKPAPKPARSAHGPLGTRRTDDGIDGGTYDDPGRYVDDRGRQCGVVVGVVVVIVDELLLLLLLLRENERGWVGGVVRGMVVLPPMSLSSLLSRSHSLTGAVRRHFHCHSLLVLNSSWHHGRSPLSWGSPRVKRACVVSAIGITCPIAAFAIISPPAVSSSSSQSPSTSSPSALPAVTVEVEAAVGWRR